MLLALFSDTENEGVKEAIVSALAEPLTKLWMVTDYCPSDRSACC